MPSLSSVYPSATQVLLLYLCKRYATEPVHPPEGYHVPTRMRERLVYEAVSADAGWCSCTATQQVSARERRAASVADDTRDCSDAWPGWGEGSGGLVVRESARQDVCCFGTTRRRAALRRIRYGGAGGRAGAERAASSVAVVLSRQRVRRELGKTPCNAMFQNPLRIKPVRLAPSHILWT
jgi:hypothetical protein